MSLTFRLWGQKGAGLSSWKESLALDDSKLSYRLNGKTIEVTLSEDPCEASGLILFWRPDALSPVDERLNRKFPVADLPTLEVVSFSDRPGWGPPPSKIGKVLRVSGQTGKGCEGVIRKLLLEVLNPDEPYDLFRIDFSDT